MNDKCFIYGLVDPRTKLIRYVGYTSRGMIRPLSHGNEASEINDNTYKGNWVRELLRNGLDYTIVVIETCSTAQLSCCEIWWIAYGRLSGWPLTNMTDGGEGRLGCPLSGEHKAKLKASHTAETHQKRTAKLRGQKRSDTQRARISASLEGRILSVEHRNKLSMRKIGNTNRLCTPTRCSACAQIGHMRSSRICPEYGVSRGK